MANFIFSDEIKITVLAPHLHENPTILETRLYKKEGYLESFISQKWMVENLLMRGSCFFVSVINLVS